MRPTSRRRPHDRVSTLEYAIMLVLGATATLVLLLVTVFA
jgi:hypothetical protein